VLFSGNLILQIRLDSNTSHFVIFAEEPEEEEAEAPAVDMFGGGGGGGGDY
jgi:hypothetical protein